MRRTPQIEVTSVHLDALLNELRAVEYWDVKYHTQHKALQHETVAYISRRRRRGEIVREIVRLMPNKPEKE